MSTSMVIYGPSRWTEAQGWPRTTRIRGPEGVWSRRRTSPAHLRPDSSVVFYRCPGTPTL